MKINFVGAFFGLVLIIGVFTPWISKGHDSFGKINPETGKLELNYHIVYKLSPIYAVKSIDGNMVERVWFVTRGLSVSAGLLLIAAISFWIRFTRMYYNFISFIFSFLGFSMFFLSMGRGQAIGVVTNLEWGFYISFLSVFLMFLFYVFELLNNPSI